MQPQIKSVPFIRRYWSLLLILGFIGVVVGWLLIWGLAMGGHTSLHWMYIHLDSATSLSVFAVFMLLGLALIIVLLLRALFRRRAYFRWRALLLAIVVLPIFLLGGFGLSEYDSIQPLASASLDGHTYQWLEFHDFMDPHYTLLDCDSAALVCHAVYRYNLGIVCNLADPRASSVQTISQNRSTARPTLRVNPTARTIEAQLNENTFFTYDIAAQHGVGPC